MKKTFLLFLIILNCNNLLAIQPKWATNYLGNYQKSVITNGHDIFALSDYELFFSTDKGNFWSAIYTPSSPDSWICLGISGERLFLGSYSSGIYFTSNFGLSWEHRTNGFGVLCYGYVDNTILAGTRGVGVYKSTDNGMNWFESNTGLTNLTVNTISSNGTEVFAGTSGGIFYSSDQGSTWAPRNNGISPTTVLSLLNKDGNIYAGTISSGIYFSTNSGLSWQTKNNGISILRVESFAANSSGVFAGIRSGIYFSSNNGDLWTQVNNGLGSSIIEPKLISVDEVIFGGFIQSLSGLYSTSNNGAIWSRVVSGLNNAVNFSLLTANNEIYTAGNSRRIYKSTNNGANWLASNPVSSNGYITAILKTDAYTLAAIYSEPGTIYKTTDNGESWTHSSIDLPDYTTVNNLYAYGTSIFACTSDSGLYISEDNANTWKSQKSDFETANCMVSNDNHLFLGTNMGIFISSDNGVIWSKTNSDSLNVNITGIVVNGNKMYSSSDGCGLFISNDGGLNWFAQNSNTKTLRYRAMTVTGKYIFIYIYALGFYYSTDDGLSYTQFNNGFPREPLYAVNHIVSLNNYIFLNSENGIYRYSISDLTSLSGNSEVIPKNYYLSQNYPNPFNPETKIEYEVPGKTFVKLIVYDILGKEIKTLVNEYKNPGKYEITFDGSELSSGIYFYSIYYEDQFETKRMVLIK